MIKRLAAAILLALPMSAFALSNSFSYQGSLNDGGTPASGSYDLQFQLQTSAGVNVGAPLVREDVAVAAGLFSVELDFGAAITSADFRLQIGVRPGASVGAFTTLSPTTNLRPAPQAQVAGIASEAVTVSPNAVNSASVANESLSGVDIQDGTLSGADIQDGEIRTADIADGTILALDVDTTVIQARVNNSCLAGSAIRAIGQGGAVTCETIPAGGSGTVTSVASGAGLTGGPITTSGTLSIATGGVTSAMIFDGTVANADLATNAVNAGNIVDGSIGSADVNTAQVQARVSGTCLAGSSIRQVNADGTVSCESDDIGWSLGGNLGTNPATQYLGTFDAQPLEIRTANARSLRIEPSAETFGAPALPITRNLIAGSHANTVSAGTRGATIAGGGLPSGESDPFFNSEAPNQVTGHFGTVGGGFANIAALGGTVAGGLQNEATGSSSSTVGGGVDNVASGGLSTVAGGFTNLASGLASSVAGGEVVSATGRNSMASGGRLNCAGGDYSWVGGRRAKARVGNEAGDGSCATGSGDADGDNGSFVWADSQDADFVSSGANQFLVRADGGFLFNTSSLPNPIDDFVIRSRNGVGDPNIDLTLLTASGKAARFEVADTSGSIYLVPGNVGAGEARLVVTGGTGGVATLSNGGTWTNASSRSYKTGFGAVDPVAILDRLVALPISTWTYRGSQEGTHLGPMAEDFKAAFDLAGDGKSISTVDADGVALAAIQGLNRKLESENAALRAELAELRRLVLERLRGES
ncbi:MAG: hypothetical protein IT479_10105 [Xanthomonadales bacterium]|nr:hypothetical protein [Xanthomonadales bacterium]MCC6593614.1 hypothetical protein [Xanthomonadales bacterium]MCE7930332.1 hypothetical protein [Xanthomonadales bacterium PRO6]